MKILVILDILLKPKIFLRASELLEKGIAEKAVCLMDIDYDFRQENNLDWYIKYNIAIEIAKDFNNTLCCYGNHDLSYI